MVRVRVDIQIIEDIRSLVPQASIAQEALNSHTEPTLALSFDL